EKDPHAALNGIRTVGVIVENSLVEMATNALHDDPHALDLFRLPAVLSRQSNSEHEFGQVATPERTPLRHWRYQERLRGPVMVFLTIFKFPSVDLQRGQPCFRSISHGVFNRVRITPRISCGAG